MSTKFQWVLPEISQNKDLVEFLLESRNISDKRKFFSPKLSDLELPESMFGVQDAYDVILEHINKGSKIFIHGDFDVDGISSTALLWQFLVKYFDADAVPFIPNRFDDGYGLSEHTVERMISEQAGLIISVDCGAKDIDLVGKYSDKVDFLITDHHTLIPASEHTTYPENYVKVVKEFLISSKARAVVHPKVNDLSKEICGAFVIWKVCQYIAQKQSLSVDFDDFLELVALGTVCDVMPLIGENRTVVQLGLQKFKTTSNVGLTALAKIADVALRDIEAYHLGFVIGPRLNAAGRLDTAMDALRLLCTKDINNAEKLANKLDALNKERQDLTTKYIEIADTEIAKQDNIIRITYGEAWPEGIVGLIAGKLTEKYNTPVIIGSLNSEGTIKSSARSIEGIHISNLLKDISELLIKHGGHALAAGLSYEQKNFQEICESLNSLVKEKDLKFSQNKTLTVDYVITEPIDEYLVSEINGFSPFGFGNKTPIFVFSEVKISNPVTMGKDKSHIKFSIENHPSIEFIGFGLANELAQVNSPVDLAVNLEIDVWNGRSKVVAKIKDWKLKS